ncbi:hypothetical protein AKJ16_DCAP26952, partial [Drosera capensis]
MDIWSRARTLAQEISTRSQELTIGGSRITEIVTETAKQASKAADQIKIEALKRADQIKSIPIGIDTSSVSVSSISAVLSPARESGGGGGGGGEVAGEEELERFGVTDELREFVKGITIGTFRDFPLPDDAPMSDVPTISNVRQDLTEWQERHATLVLSTVKEISKLRYELCPRIMKDRKFWRIYFILVNSHVTPYEKRYMSELAAKSKEEKKDDRSKENPQGDAAPKPDGAAASTQTKARASSSEQDLDVFLLGDLGDSDEEGPGKLSFPSHCWMRSE